MIDGSPLNVLDFGAIGDGVNDDTSAIQAAITAAETNGGQRVYFPAGKYKCTSTINVPTGLTICGDTAGINSFANLGTPETGTWFYFNHTGKGFSVVNPASSSYGYVLFSSIGTYRNQPADTIGWTPTANDYDFYITGVTDITLDDVFLLNPTKGVYQEDGGRINLYKIKGQPLEKGIVISKALDVCRFDQIHFFPYWSATTNVMAYQLANMDSFQFYRCDNPLLSNVFTISAKSGIRFSQNANGFTSKLKLVNADFDGCDIGIWVDSSVVGGCSGHFANVSFQGQDVSSTSTSMKIEGNDAIFTLVNYRSTKTALAGVTVTGGNSYLTFSNTLIETYDQNVSNLPAFNQANTNTIKFGTFPTIVSSGGTGGVYSATGLFLGSSWIGFTPSVGAQTGTITTLGTCTGLYRIEGSTVYVQAVINITTNGTGAGFVKMILPQFTAAAQTVGVGKETAVTGKFLNTYVVQPNNYVAITYADGTYPGANGVQLVVDFSYVI